MSTITSLKLGSVPITEEGVERYRFTDNIENHFTQIYERIEDLNCSVGRIFSKMKVPVSWFEVMNANYLIADMDINNPSGSTLHIKGWIDAIDLLSDSEDYPQVEIRWHFDYYEMYKSMITLGYGHVKRRPFGSIGDTPVQNYQFRYLELSTSDPATRLDPAFVKNSREVWWVIINYNTQYDVGGTTYTGIASLTYPVYCGNAAGPLYFSISDLGDGNNPKTVYGPSVASIMDGRLDEYLGIDPDDIIGVWVSPMAPGDLLITNTYTPSGSGASAADPLVWTQAYGYSMGSYGYFETHAGTAKKTVTFNPAIMSTETERYVLAGMDGTKLLELPYGMSISGVDLLLYNEPDGPYIEATFRDGSLGNLEGCTVNIPLPMLPVNSNAWSSYVYSGKRDYDIEMRTITSNTNAWRNAGGGAANGAMMGAFGPQGLALGVAGGLAGGLITYGVEMLYTNDEEQRQEDRLAANQASSLILSSGSVLPTYRHLGISLHKISPDSYSLAQISNMRNNFGVSVDEILSSCDNLVKGLLPVGYYIIKNMIISGAAPKEAKDYIKNKFDAGVKLL